MRRREVITLLGAAAAWPLAARAQQPDGKVRRIAFLDIYDLTDRVTRERWDVMRAELAKLGWTEGRNARFEDRFAGDSARLGISADELVRLAPDVIAVASGPAAQALARRTSAIPIVFSNVGDPAAIGLLRNIARPEGNVTGIASQYQSLGGKWLELLKEAAPGLTRVALVFAPDMVNDQYFGVIDSAAATLGIRAVLTPYRNSAELEHAIATFAAEPNGALVLMPPPPAPINRALINRLALIHRLPTIYSNKYNVAEGGLMSYGANNLEAQRRVASYVDRILRGVKINELPVQFPTKFDLVINLRTAKAIGLAIPGTFLALADEVIE